MNFKLGEILPQIYHLSFGSGYDLAMHFIRAQEYYESPKYWHKVFTLVDYMEWYSKGKGKGSFTYPADWSGFNVPSSVLLDLYGKSGVISDFNRYDEFMKVIIDRLVKDCDSKDFYLIGTSGDGHQGDGDEEGVLMHEIAHGLFYVDPEYNKEVRALMMEMPKSEREEATEALKNMGYHISTIGDEIHAYASTGLCTTLEGILSEKTCEPFVETFSRISKQKFAERVKSREASS